MKKEIAVAVAVIATQNADNPQFLLARRHAHQHQGGKLEFVGGKIEQGETAKNALIREVGEELGVAIDGCQIHKMGVICHDYGDKLVKLIVYRVFLCDVIYQTLANQSVGTDNQALSWHSLDELLALKNALPTANAQILDWLTLPSVLPISDSLENLTNAGVTFVERYQNLPKSALLRVRLSDDCERVVPELYALAECRPDLSYLVPMGLLDFDKNLLEKLNIKGVHLTQNEVAGLGAGDWGALQALKKLKAYAFLGLKIISSCHDEKSVNIINALQKKLPIWAVFVSPIKPTQTHLDALPIGFDGLAKLVQACDVPVWALGGLTLDDLFNVQSVGAVGVAGIRGFG